MRTRKPQFTYQNETLNGYPCLTHRVTGENAIYGKFGELFLINSTTYGVRLFNLRRARKAGLLKGDYGPLDEALLKVGPSQFETALDCIGATRYGSVQANYAALDEAARVAWASVKH